MKSKKLRFPKGFLWGSSISSHQTEGDNVNDWSEWELSEKRLAELERAGHIEKYGLENFISKKAANHFYLYKEDYALAKKMGHKALRLSLEWSRIEPKEGEFSEEAILRYREMIKHLLELGIEPFVTLWHWTMPTWLRDRGGWENSETPNFFRRYVEKTVGDLKEEVKFWVTINEPEIYSGVSYLLGIWPPQKKNPFTYIKVFRNLIKGHRAAYDLIHQIRPDAKVGIAKNNIYFTAHRGIVVNKMTAKFSHWWNNNYFLNKISDKQDYIGLNYYFSHPLHLGRVKKNGHLLSDLGWELHPEGIYHLLLDLKKYKKPVYITENGIADATDTRRAWFIAQILKYVHKAIEKGVDVRGYLHWSLIDNFEWHEGFHPRFGLVEVDYKTQKRRVRPSAEFYSEIIKKNQLSVEDVENMEEM